ncbi:MAG: glycosyl transferase [Rhodobacter sp.]|nr:glycosyl transferase [Rhodobacter sp.]
MNHSSAAPAVSVIIAARNEEHYIQNCLQALIGQDAVESGPIEVIVAANACTDATVAKAREMISGFEARGWTLQVISLADGGKLGAISSAEQAATGRSMVYLDADVLCDPALLGQLAKVLDVPRPLYATGRIAVARSDNIITRAYARIWQRLPFVEQGAVGAGLFAMNRAGRARWGDWPRIISDDTFARLQFAPHERIEVAAQYHWPMVEGFRNLVRVRRRQDEGVKEVRRLYPALLANEAKAPVSKARAFRLLMADPLGFGVYLAVHLAVRLKPATAEWTRGR